MPETPDLNVPAIGISLTHTVAENRNIVFQGFIPAAAPRAELDALLDKLFAASARQQAIATLPGLRKRLANEEKMLVRATEDIYRLDNEGIAADSVADALHATSGKRGARAVTPLQRQEEAKRQQDRANAKTTLERYRYDIERLREEIAEQEDLIGA
jgi:hypothetical protein